MTLQQLKYFLAAAERGSFSAAAESLLLAQPSLSEQIRRLEAELGVALFTRAGRAARADRGGAHAAAARGAHAARGGGSRGLGPRRARARGRDGELRHVRLRAPHLLGGLVEEFRQRYPDVRVRVMGQNSVEVADAIRDGELEAGLVALPVDDRGLDVRPAFREEIHYVSADPAARAQAEDDRGIAAGPLILYDARWGAVDPLRRQLAERAQQAGVRLEPQIEVEYLTAALELAARGLGDTVARADGDRHARLLAALHSVSLDPPMYDTFAFVTRRNAQLSPATRALMDVRERRSPRCGGLD